MVKHAGNMKIINKFDLCQQRHVINQQNIRLINADHSIIELGNRPKIIEFLGELFFFKLLSVETKEDIVCKEQKSVLKDLIFD